MPNCVGLKFESASAAAFEILFFSPLQLALEARALEIGRQNKLGPQWMPFANESKRQAHDT